MFIIRLDATNGELKERLAAARAKMQAAKAFELMIEYIIRLDFEEKAFIDACIIGAILGTERPIYEDCNASKMTSEQRAACWKAFDENIAAKAAERWGPRPE